MISCQVVAPVEREASTVVADTPFTNPLGQQVLYFDPATTHGVLIHLTQLPAQPNTVGVGKGVQVDHIIHAGYLVRNVAEAVAWYVDKFDGVHVGGGASRRGGRNAFVNFGQVQVELIEPQDPSTMGAHHAMDHVGYVTREMGAAITECRRRGFQFAADAPNTNACGLNQYQDEKLRRLVTATVRIGALL